MASPPFDLNIAVPGDTDIASQFPAVDRANLDIIESWLLVEHNTQGRHAKVSIDWVADMAGTASVTRIWASSTGNNGGELVKRIADTGSVEFVGPPPGAIVAYAGSSAPNGWVLCDGSLLSRSTYARLFAAIGTNYGAGDGTNFGVPDLRGRIPVGKDNMGGSAQNRITTAGSGIDGVTLGASGGAQTLTMARTDMPNINLTQTLSHLSAGATSISPSAGDPTAGTAGGVSFNSYVNTVFDAISDHSVSLALNGGVTQTAMNKMPPGLIVNYIIKT